MKLHTLLGATGAITQELVPILQSHNEKIRLVSRKQQPKEGTETMVADLLHYDQALKAIEGSAIVYMLVGMTYDAKIWARDWPVVMRNVMDACKATGAKLLFFDVAYMYGKVNGIITESTPYHPSSRKGAVRAEVAKMLEAEMKSGAIKAVIARAVDFYGPGVTLRSAVGTFVFANMKKGKKAQWQINADVPRSYNYTPDAAQAVYLLATDDGSYGQIWHLPSVYPALTGRQFVKIAAKYMNASDKVTLLPRWALKISGWFIPFMKEMYEMNYQDAHPFQFDSSKFENAFGFTPTPYEQAIKITAEWYLKS
jgi:nucleoside-diphosphate-sugar epimerase